MSKEITFNFYEINALNKLLGKIKFETKMDAEDLSYFATSPFIISVFEKIHLAYREPFLEDSDLPEQIVINGKNRFQFNEGAVDIHNLKRRLKNLTEITRVHIKSLNDKELESYCDDIFAPFIPTKKQKEEILNFLIEIKSN